MNRILFCCLLATLMTLDTVPSSAQEPPSAERRTAGAPWLGVVLAKDEAGSGVGLEQVLRNSPASHAGLRPGDRIISINGVQVNSAAHLQMLVRGHRAGESLEVMARRAGKPFEATVKLVSMPDPTKLLEDQLLGAPAPAFELDLLGPEAKRRSLSTFAGKPTILEFWATWCGPCRAVNRELENLEKTFGDAINIIGVTSEDRPTVTRHIEEHGMKYPLALDIDERGHTAYFVRSYPVVYLLDHSHRIVGIYPGAGYARELRRDLEALLKTQSDAP